MSSERLNFEACRQRNPQNSSGCCERSANTKTTRATPSSPPPPPPSEEDYRQRVRQIISSAMYQMPYLYANSYWMSRMPPDRGKPITWSIATSHDSIIVWGKIVELFWNGRSSFWLVPQFFHLSVQILKRLSYTNLIRAGLCFMCHGEDLHS